MKNNQLFWGDGRGGFTEVTDDPSTMAGGNTYYAIVVDVDMDSLPDLYVSNKDANNQLFLGSGAGRVFAQVMEGPAVEGGGMTYMTAVADFDNDNFPDLFLTNYDQKNAFLTADGSLVHHDVTDAAPGEADSSKSKHAASADINNDGHKRPAICYDLHNSVIFTSFWPSNSSIAGL